MPELQMIPLSVVGRGQVSEPTNYYAQGQAVQAQRLANVGQIKAQAEERQASDIYRSSVNPQTGELDNEDFMHKINNDPVIGYENKRNILRQVAPQVTQDHINDAVKKNGPNIMQTVKDLDAMGHHDEAMSYLQGISPHLSNALTIKRNILGETAKVFQATGDWNKAWQYAKNFGITEQEMPYDLDPDQQQKWSQAYMPVEKGATSGMGKVWQMQLDWGKENHDKVQETIESMRPFMSDAEYQTFTANNDAGLGYKVSRDVMAIASVNPKIGAATRGKIAQLQSLLPVKAATAAAIAQSKQNINVKTSALMQVAKVFSQKSANATEAGATLRQIYDKKTGQFDPQKIDHTMANELSMAVAKLVSSGGGTLGEQTIKDMTQATLAGDLSKLAGYLGIRNEAQTWGTSPENLMRIAHSIDRLGKQANIISNDAFNGKLTTYQGILPEWQSSISSGEGGSPSVVPNMEEHLDPADMNADDLINSLGE